MTFNVRYRQYKKEAPKDTFPDYDAQRWLKLQLGPTQACVYLYIVYDCPEECTFSDSVYVGQITATHHRKIQDRHRSHVYAKNHTLFDDLLKDHKYYFTILWVGEKCDADATERYYIKFFDSLFPNGLNLNDGGHMPTKASDRTREKISKNHARAGGRRAQKNEG